ncbi:MAG: protoglobin domain-containing protein [Planctomycetota bacterium]|nr:protoglobin domain-containing protein [Planctomycetota bacterium]
MTASQDSPPVRGIDAIRRSLGLGAAEQELVYAAGPSLLPHIEAWVDAFYTRLLVDPVAVRILDDDGRVIRLKRSLRSWFHELLTLPWDRDYERARARVGDAHVHIQMPTDLMVTAMSGMRAEVTGTVRRLWPTEPERTAQVVDVLARALDMELALMLLAFRRRERALARQKDRMVYAQRSARRLAHTVYDRVDAALCYAELVAQDDPRRGEWLARLRDVLRGLARVDQRLRVQAKVNGVPPEQVAVSELCRLALADVSADGDTHLECIVEPPELTARLVAPAARLAIEELAQNSARHARGGTVRVHCTAGSPAGIRIEVTDEGPGWPPEIREFRDIYREGSGLGLSFCELVAELHEGHIELFDAPGGGAGVRLDLIAHGPVPEVGA